MPSLDVHIAMMLLLIIYALPAILLWVRNVKGKLWLSIFSLTLGWLLLPWVHALVEAIERESSQPRWIGHLKRWRKR